MNQMKAFLGLSELGKEEGRGGVSDGERAGTPLGAIWDGDTIIVWGLFTDFQTFWWVRRKASCLRARTALFLCLPKPIWRGKQKPSQTSPLLLHLNAPDLLAGAASDCRVTSEVCWSDVPLDAAQIEPNLDPTFLNVEMEPQLKQETLHKRSINWACPELTQAICMCAYERQKRKEEGESNYFQ